MSKIHRRGAGALLTTAFVLGAASLVWTASAKSSNQEPSPSPLLNKNEWQEGEACVKSDAKCDAQYRGVCRTARAPGCDHTKSCTAAKNQARADLRAVVPQACYPYITSTSRCKSGPGCRSAAQKATDQK